MIEQVFKDWCKEVNEGFDKLALLVELTKSNSDELQEIIKEAENGK